MKVQGISHLTIEVAQLKKAEEFYCGVLGFEPSGYNLWPECGNNAALKTAAGQWLVLSENTPPRSLPETGVHQAYRVAPGDRSAIARRLEARDIAVRSYKEDRPQEEEHNCYFHDADGNRIQLVAVAGGAGGGRVLGIDHTAVESPDLEWAEDFYVNVLGLPVDHRVGWKTADYVRAKLWGEGKEEMAPGTRRWDQRYTVMEQKRRLPRPNMHFFVRLGDAVLGVYLALEHRQEPPEEQMVGSPRIGLRTSRRALEETARRLAQRRCRFQGPVEHPASTPIATSLYCKDPAGNFLEFSVAR